MKRQFIIRKHFLYKIRTDIGEIINKRNIKERVNKRDCNFSVQLLTRNLNSRHYNSLKTNDLLKGNSQVCILSLSQEI